MQHIWCLSIVNTAKYDILAVTWNGNIMCACISVRLYIYMSEWKHTCIVIFCHADKTLNFSNKWNEELEQEQKEEYKE